MATHEAIRRQSVGGRAATRIPGTPGQSVRLAVLHTLPKRITVKGDKATGLIGIPIAPIGGFSTDSIEMFDQQGDRRNFIFYNGGPLPPVGPEDVLVNTGGGFDADAVAQNFVNAVNGELPAFGVQAAIGPAIDPLFTEVTVTQAFAGSSGNTTISHLTTNPPKDNRVTVSGFSGGTDGLAQIRYMRRICSRIPGNPNRQILRAVRRILRRNRT